MGNRNIRSVRSLSSWLLGKADITAALKLQLQSSNYIAVLVCLYNLNPTYDVTVTVQMLKLGPKLHRRSSIRNYQLHAGQMQCDDLWSLMS